jgi:hypothetical protein
MVDRKDFIVLEEDLWTPLMALEFLEVEKVE